MATYDRSLLRLLAVFVLWALFLLMRYGAEHLSTKAEKPYQDIEVGTGPVARDGMHLVLHDKVSLQDGTLIHSSFETGEPKCFLLGSDRMIEGWNRGVRGMRVGGRRRFIVPPHLAHTHGRLKGVPSGSSLVFEVELLGVNTPGWAEDPATGCKIWDPVPLKQESFRWSGPCIDGKASGSGVLMTHRGGKEVERYVGEMVRGRPEGQGRREWLQSGARYRGSYRDGYRHGYGQMTYSDGAYYEGEFSRAARSGTGVMVYADGRRYAGPWSRSFRDGRGVETLPGGRWRTVHYSKDDEVHHGRSQSSSDAGPLAEDGIVGVFSSMIHGYPYESRLKAAAMVHLIEPSWVESPALPALEEVGSKGLGTFILETGPWCGEGEFRVLGDQGEEPLECCDWQNIGVSPVFLPAGDYKLSYTVGTCGGESFSGERILFSIEADRTTLVHLILRPGYFSLERW